MRAAEAQLLDDLRRLAVDRRPFVRPVTEADAGMIEVSTGQRPGMWDRPAWTAYVRRHRTGVARVYLRRDVPVCAVIDLGDPITGEVIA